MTAATAGVAAVATGVTPERLIGLRRWNLGLGVLHLAQAVAVLLLASGFAITVTSAYPTGPPGTAIATAKPLFDVRIGVAIAVFLALAAADHLLTATALRARYENDLTNGRTGSAGWSTRSAPRSWWCSSASTRVSPASPPSSGSPARTWR